MVSTRRLMGAVRRKLVPKHSLSQAELDHWSNWRKTGAGNRPDFLRLALPAERATRLVRRRVRFGTKIRLQQVGSVPDTPKEEALLQQAREEIRSRWTDRFSSKGMESLLARARVLTQTAFLRKRLGGRDPMAYQVLAVAALQHGLDSPAFWKQVYAMQHVESRYPAQKSWVGNVTTLRRAFLSRISPNKRLLSSLEQLLFNSQTKALDSRSILERLGLPHNKKNLRNLNVVCQFLETVGLIKKYPAFSAGGPSVYAVWIHASHPNPPLDYPNAAMGVLSSFVQGSVPHGLAAISRIRKVPHRGKVYLSGSRTAHRAEQNVSVTARKLVDVGLLEKDAGSKRNFQLSPLGRELMEEYQRTQSLPERLRKLLLGEKGKNKTSDQGY